MERWEGNRAVSLSRLTPHDTKYAYWAQTIFADDFRGGPATLRVRIKTDLVGTGAALVVRGDDTLTPSGNAETGASTQGQVSITGIQDWTEYSVTLDDVLGGLKSLTVYLLFAPGTSGTVFFDGATLVR